MIARGLVGWKVYFLSPIAGLKTPLPFFHSGLQGCRAAKGAVSRPRAPILEEGCEVYDRLASEVTYVGGPRAVFRLRSPFSALLVR